MCLEKSPYCYQFCGISIILRLYQIILVKDYIFMALRDTVYQKIVLGLSSSRILILIFFLYENITVDGGHDSVSSFLIYM